MARPLRNRAGIHTFPTRRWTGVETVSAGTRTCVRAVLGMLVTLALFALLAMFAVFPMQAGKSQKPDN